MDAFAEDTWDKSRFCEGQLGFTRDERATTDDLLYTLSSKHPRTVLATRARVREAETGADLEIWIKDGTRAIGILVQAKGLKQTNGGQYEGLDRTTTSGDDQPTALIRSAAERAMFPLYFFYSGGSANFTRGPCGLDRGIKTRGVMVSSAAHAQSLAARSGTASVVDVNEKSIPWGCLVLCPGGLLRQPRPDIPNRIKIVLDLYFDSFPQESTVLEWESVPRGIQGVFDHAVASRSALAGDGDLQEDPELLTLASEASVAEYLLIIDSSS